MKLLFTLLSIGLSVSVLATDFPIKPVKNKLKFDASNGGISLAKGFKALVVHEGVGKARHIDVAPNGDIYVKLSKLESGKGIVALRDADGDGKAEIKNLFGAYRGTGMSIHNGYLYASSDTSVYRYKMTANGLLDDNAKAETIVTGLKLERQHESKPVTLDDDGHLFVTFGAPSNSCQETDRKTGSKGIEPCPIRDNYAGIWQFDANKLNQKQSDGVRYASGIRNAVALEWNKSQKQLYGLQHGRDDLHRLFPDLYTVEQSTEFPSEEFMLIKKGSDFGWPYCYNDHAQNKKVTAPEYGGDGKQVSSRCEAADKPIMAFPAHWAPNDLLFYTGNQFPAKYKNGAFVCFHGSWNRAPLKQAGYFVAFIPMGKDGKPSGNYEVFAENFAGIETVMNPSDAKARPMGLAQSTDGSLYITDSVKGKIWRVMYDK